MSGMLTLKKNITKKQINNFLKRYWHVFASILLVFTSGLILSWIYRNQLNPDGVSYIQSAKHYANLDFKTAINGYWSPLLAWLLVPFIWFSIDPVFAARAINFIVSILIVSFVLLLINRREYSWREKLLQFLMVTSFGILLVEWGASTITPDLLSGAILFAILLSSQRYLDCPTPISSLILGFSLSMLYFVKSIGIYIGFVLVAFTILKLNRSQSPNKAMLISILLTAFLVPIILWISAISIKYDSLTITTASAYNFSLIGPERPTHPQSEQGYLETRHASDIWGWDDPSYFEMPQWKVQEHLSYYITNVVITAEKTLSYFFELSPLVVLALLAISYEGIRKKFQHQGIWICIVLIFSAYSLTLVEKRYLWLIAIPLIALGIISFSSAKNLYKKFAIPVLGLIFLSTLSSLFVTFESSTLAQLDQEGVKRLSVQASEIIPAHSSIAGPEMVYQFCYYTSTRCLGNYNFTQSLEYNNKILSQMRAHKIDYYVTFGDTKNITGIKRIYKKNTPESKCYDRSHDKAIMCHTSKISVYRLYDK